MTELASHILIRPATLADAKAIQAIYDPFVRDISISFDVDPPSSMHRLTVQDLSDKAHKSWIVALGDPVRACVVASPSPHAFYLEKMAVDASLRGQGVAWELVAACADIARELGHDRLELQVRIELAENQKAFVKLGFVKVSENCHPGYDHVTEINMQKVLDAVVPFKLSIYEIFSNDLKGFAFCHGRSC